MGMIVGYILITWFIIIASIVTGENCCKKYPDSKFGKWWRKHLIAEFDEDNENDKFTLL